MPVTSVSPLGALRQDHKVIREQLLRLEEVLPQLTPVSGPAFERSREILAEIVAFLSQELEAHLLKEETILFSYLDKVEGDRLGAVADMRSEHDQMRENNQALRQIIRQLEAGQDDADIRARLERLCVAAMGLIRRHLDPEDSVIFRIAEEMLSPQALRAVAKRMTPHSA